MPKTPGNTGNLSPYKLLHNFSKNRVVACILLALIIHVAIIGGLSTDYIYRTWIDPTANTDEQTAKAPGQGKSGDGKPSGETSGEIPPTDAEKNGAAVKDSTKPGDPGEDAPVVNRVTDKADPDTIPKQPAGVGISIDDLYDGTPE